MDIMVVIILAGIIATANLFGWIAYLWFCWLLAKQTNDSSSLKDAAGAAKAFRATGLAALAQAVVKMTGRARH